MAELPKGTRVIVIGHLEQESWNDKTTGKKRSKHVVKAREAGPSVRWTPVTMDKRAPKVPSAVKEEVEVVTFVADEEPF